VLPHRKKISKKVRFRQLFPFFIKNHKAIPVISLPCSASSYFVFLLERSLGIKSYQLKQENGFGQLTLDLRKAPFFSFRPFILYQHLYPTRRNVSLVDSISLSDFIILYRRPEDWIISCAAQLKIKKRVPWSDYIDYLKINQFSNDELIEYIITFELPKYLTFLNGWHNANSFYNTKNKAFFVKFDNIVNNTSSTLEEVLSLYPQLKSNAPSHKELSTNVNRRSELIDFKLSKSDKEKIKSMCKKYNLAWVYE